ncbi:hypothetical protein CVV38_03100 [Candidatus Peregrinibacteria bacterium HGW-Peregrinibacteria-1]|jgi:predicted nucleotidyltransferase|nr:MAG: hypothetical protein CVV38_03100 [Candidatus Peregrinibacteria bacterium HGW-Peregrinibacteria-1]
MSELEDVYWQRVAKYCKRLRVVPFVKMVAVCNSLAMGDFDEDSDIDLFVVARRGRLFVVRFLITMIMHLSGVRRHGEKVKGRFCLSFFVDERAANLEKIAIQDDIYLARWVVSLWPVIEEERYGDVFVRENEWVYQGLVKGRRGLNRRRLLKVGGIGAKVRSGLEWILGGRLGNWVEKRMRGWQIRRFEKKFVPTAENKDGVIVNELMLKFHEKDRRREYRDGA